MKFYKLKFQSVLQHILFIFGFISLFSYAQDLEVYKFSLYDESANKSIAGYGGLKNGQEINLDKISAKNVNIKAFVRGSAKSVHMELESRLKRTEEGSPWLLFLESHDGLRSLSSGTYHIFARPYSKDKKGGVRGDGMKLTFKLKNSKKVKRSPSSSGGKAKSGPPSSIPDKNKKYVRNTIVITKPGVYDYKKRLHIWKGKGSCSSQKEGQPPILKIMAPNVTIKNFYYKNAPDGIHVNCKKASKNKCGGPIPRNVRFINVRGVACEDALTIKDKANNITIKDSLFIANPNKKYRDKTLQITSGKKILIDNVRFKGGERCVRAKSGADITIRNSIFDGCRYPVKADTKTSYFGTPKGKTARIRSEKNTFKNCKQAFDADDSKVKYSSSGDKFSSCKKGDV